MALKLENEFVVTAPIEQTWRTLLDLERVAGCLPGAQIARGEDEGTFSGSMRVKLGPVTMDYKGTARIEEVDESNRVAVFILNGKETRGQGSASATIRNQLVDRGGSTQVRVETELSVTGRPAQFGRGIMQDVATAMLADFANCLSAMMSGGNGQDAAGSDGAGTGSSPAGLHPASEQPAPLDLTRTVRGVLARRITGALGLRRLGAFLAKIVRRPST
jgi:uncharacterized protein